MRGNEDGRMDGRMDAEQTDRDSYLTGMEVNGFL